MTPVKPTLELLRSLTDEHVLRALMLDRRLTRADLAVRTGISKPTVIESVRRLTAAGLLIDTGELSTGRGRGRVGSYYALAPDLHGALVAGIAPSGIVAERIDAHGDTVSRATLPIRAGADVAATLLAVAIKVTGGATGLAFVSAADPVDRATGRLVHLPDAPFLVGDLSPVDVLSRIVAGPVVVDNDVNWAARAERDAGGAGGKADDFAYVFLGEGLGCAVVSDGEVRRGHAGIAGEIAHLVTAGPDGDATAFTEVFATLGLRRAGGTAIDVPLLLDRAHGPVLAAIGRAVSGVLAAIVALSDPAEIVIGGSWGPHPAVLAAITEAFERLPRHVPVRAARLDVEPSLAGARNAALDGVRSAIVARARRRIVDG